jgi:C1A family cysteine protease
VGAHCLLQQQAKGTYTPLSRLYFYYYERVIENNYSALGLTDSGADVKDGFQYAKTKGICLESLWPYVISKYNSVPPSICDQNAATQKISSYALLPVNSNILTTIKNYLATTQKPILIAMNVYQNFMSISTMRTGIIPLQSGSPIGGHEMYILGYNDTTKYFTLANSWGSYWGANGLCYLPYTYLNRLSDIYELSVFSL